MPEKSQPKFSGGRQLTAGGTGRTRTETASNRGTWTRRIPIVVAAIVVIAPVALTIEFLREDSITARFNTQPARAVAAATFVGSEACAGCHRSEAALWRGSQHRLAMQHATDKSVLGDFNDSAFDQFGVHSRFFR